MAISHKPRHRGKVSVNWLFMLPALLVAVLTAVLTVPANTFAQAALYDSKYEYEVPAGRPAYGALNAIRTNQADGYPAWCIQSGTFEPTPDQVLTPSTLTAPTVVAPAELRLSTPQMAYVLHKVGKSMDGVTEGATSYLVHANYEIPSVYNRDAQATVNLMITDVKRKYPEVHARAVELAREARSSAVIEYAASKQTGSDKRTGTVDNIGSRNEKGEWVPNIPVTVTLEGPAKFDATNSVTWTGVTKNEPISLSWTGTGNGTVNVSAKYPAIKRKTLTKLGANGDIQDTISYGNRPGGADPDTIIIPGETFNVVYDFQPMATSNVGDAKISNDGVLKDTIKVFADPKYGQGTWMELDGAPVPVMFEGSAYWVGEELPAQSDTIPAGAELIGTTTVVAHGAGDYTATLNEKATKPGFITWVWRVVKAKQTHSHGGVTVSELVHADWADAFGLPDETSSVPFMVTVDSSAIARDSKAGTHLGDDLWVKGFPENHTKFNGGAGFKADPQTMNQHLYFFPEDLPILDENKDKAELIGTVQVPATNGYHKLVGMDKFLIDKENPAPGCYAFVTEFAGSDRVKPFITSVTDKKEQYCVGHPEVGLKTTAYGKDGVKVLDPAPKTELFDKVCPTKPLIVGKEYEVETFLMDAEKGTNILGADGKPVTVRKSFVPKDAHECFIASMSVDTTKLQGTEIVFFENLYYKGKKIGIEADLKNKDQTVTIRDFSGDNNKRRLPNTGIAGGFALAALFTGTTGIALRRKARYVKRH